MQVLQPEPRLPTVLLLAGCHCPSLGPISKMSDSDDMFAKLILRDPQTSIDPLKPLPLPRVFVRTRGSRHTEAVQSLVEHSVAHKHSLSVTVDHLTGSPHLNGEWE